MGRHPERSSRRAHLARPVGKRQKYCGIRAVGQAVASALMVGPAPSCSRACAADQSVRMGLDREDSERHAGPEKARLVRPGRWRPAVASLLPAESAERARVEARSSGGGRPRSVASHQVFDCGRLVRHSSHRLPATSPSGEVIRRLRSGYSGPLGCQVGHHEGVQPAQRSCCRRWVLHRYHREAGGFHDG